MHRVCSGIDSVSPRGLDRQDRSHIAHPKHTATVMSEYNDVNVNLVYAGGKIDVRCTGNGRILEGSALSRQ